MPIRRIQSRGQALAEFSLVIPFFLLLLYGILEFGRYVYAVQILNNAAREGARYAIVHGSTSLCPSGPMPGGTANWCDPNGDKVKEVVQGYAIGVSSSVTFPAITGCPSTPVNPCWWPSNQRDNDVSLRVQMTYSPILPLPLPPITVEGSSTLVVNH